MEARKIGVALHRLDQARVGGGAAVLLGFLQRARQQRLRSRHADRFGQRIGELLLDQLARDLPVRARHHKILFQHVLIARDGLQALVRNRKQHAAAEAPPQAHQQVEELLLLLLRMRRFHLLVHVARHVAHVLAVIIHRDHRHSHAPQRPDHSQPHSVGAQHDRRGHFLAAAHHAALGSSAPPFLKR